MLVLVLSMALAVLIAALATALVLAQRQYEGAAATGGRPGAPTEGPPPLPPSRYASSSLAAVAASALEATGRTRPRNSAEHDAVASLRVALARAVDGDFRAEVRDLIEAAPGVRAIHDVCPVVHDDAERPGPASTIDHLAVGPAGIYVITSLVCSERLELADDGVVAAGPAGHRPHPMVDDLRARLRSVAPAAGPVPHAGLIVLSDVLALPDEVRMGWAVGPDVTLITPSRLVTTLTSPGPVRDLDLVIAQLRDAFEPAVPVDEPLRLGTGS